MKPLLIAMLLPIALAAQTPARSWLDRPLVNWNSSAHRMPSAPANEEPIADVGKRCDVKPKRTTSGERAVTDAGWLPFYLFDRQIVQGDVEIIGGLAGADCLCRPADYNVFVFVAGRFAGTLSPDLMTSRLDGSIGAVRLSEEGTIAAEFTRYVDPDPLCCPSGRVTVRYQLDRRSTPPVVVPVAAQPTRR